MSPEQAGWAILTSAVFFGGELVVWFQGHLERSRRAFVRAVHRELRSRAGGGFGAADQFHPQGRSAPAAGVERGVIPHRVAAPPAPCTSKPTPSSAKSWSSQPLAGAVVPQPAAPVRPPRVMVHG